MNVAYACNCMYIVNFKDEILLRGEECKTRVNLKRTETINCRYNVG